MKQVHLARQWTEKSATVKNGKMWKNNLKFRTVIVPLTCLSYYIFKKMMVWIQGHPCFNLADESQTTSDTFLARFVSGLCLENTGRLNSEHHPRSRRKHCTVAVIFTQWFGETPSWHHGGSMPNKYDLWHTNEPCNLFINHHGCLCWQGPFLIVFD